MPCILHFIFSLLNVFQYKLVIKLIQIFLVAFIICIILLLILFSVFFLIPIPCRREVSVYSVARNPLKNHQKRNRRRLKKNRPRSKTNHQSRPKTKTKRSKILKLKSPCLTHLMRVQISIVH